MASSEPDPSTVMSQPHQVPTRAILTTIGLVLATSAAIILTWQLRRIIAFVLIAAFFATVLSPVVDMLTRLRFRRGLATTIVFFTGVALFSAMAYAFVRPVYDESRKFADDLPGFVERAKTGEGRVGSLIQRYDVDDWIEKNAPKLKKALSESGGPALRTASKVASSIFGLLTILVIAFLMLLEAPGIIATFLAVFPPGRRERVRRIGNDAARAITGYMAGNLLISLIAGTTTYVSLRVTGVPFAFVLSLWVAFADLLPLVGATVGAVPTILVAFLHSTGAGIAMLIVYIVYQQIENHILQPTVMSRTVRLNPLWVLLSVLVGVELAGILGALLAIPTAGVIQVVVRDVWDEAHGHLKDVPSVGEDEISTQDIA